MCMLHLPTAEKRCVETNYHLDVTCLPAPVVPAALSTTALQGNFLQVYLTRVTGSLQVPKVPWTSLLVPCRHLCVHLADNFVHFAGTVQAGAREILETYCGAPCEAPWRHLARHVVGGTVQACAYTVLVPRRHLTGTLEAPCKSPCKSPCKAP